MENTMFIYDDLIIETDGVVMAAYPTGDRETIKPNLPVSLDVEKRERVRKLFDAIANDVMKYVAFDRERLIELLDQMNGPFVEIGFASSDDRTTVTVSGENRYGVLSECYLVDKPESNLWKPIKNSG